MRRALVVSALVLLSGCGRYADFTLPVLGGNSGLHPRWDVLPEPVLGPGDWDSRDVLNPSVIRRGSELWNLYSGYDGRTWHTGLAVSSDGRSWKRLGRVLSPDSNTWESSYIAANGAALTRGDEVLYWYQAGEHARPRIGLARSADGRAWRREDAPVLPYGPRGSWDERGVGDPYVIEQSGWLYMYYLGQDRARRQRLGVARSRDGVTWEKLRTNPILELGDAGAFDEIGLGEPAVFVWRDWYLMLYTGRDRKEQRRIGIAQSRDGVHWRRLPVVFSGEQPWNREVVCDPTVMIENGTIRVWFGGGDKPSPDENLDGRIGSATLGM